MKAILSPVPDIRWTNGTFDVSSEFFQGDSLEREVYVKNLEGPGFWVLNIALYGLRDGARNWYDRFHRHCLGLGFSPIPGDPAAYNYARDRARGSLAIHICDALTAGNSHFYDSVIVPLLSQFSISKIEKKEFLGSSKQLISL